ncbi:PhoH family protein [Deferribacter autotrophicus]|uniref:PhoH family protein n=1 Tax=Deferribacter autotrophicus TaxID=500465 RepID=A0A5A8F3F0_9BACT|nr:PhoH family protein [Deferribacter autotrophicus]KAA0258665.1 PhoH family protein [Deferribacter autotrophicus]
MINYVFDTNVLLYDPMAIFSFENGVINIPITVIEEIDIFKKHMDQTGYNARFVARKLDELRKLGDLSKGVKIKNGSIVRVNVCNHELNKYISGELIRDKADNLILSVAKYLKEKENKEVIFVTKDANLRIKADVLGIKAIDFEKDRVEIESFFDGVREISLKERDVNTLYSEGRLEIELDLKENEYVIVKSEGNEKHSALARYSKKKKMLKRIEEFKSGIWGIFARNAEQRFAFDALMDDNIKLVCLMGIAGTGKTLLALAAGLKKVADDSIYKKLLVARPILPMGKDLGYLPGELHEKLHPWMQPIYDNLQLILSAESSLGNGGYSYKALIEQNIIEVEALTYIRGRSMPNQFFIVDEAQNLTPHEIKTILTRAGENTKVVLTGDPYQIDNPYIDYHSNGLTYVIDRFSGDEIAATVTLIKGERSELATKAANKL